ncbi:MAG TPA: uroporphyrinogen-III synthase [Saprospiraceae bacterium]|nr:uroporphyrinogen-III synthase [Saprospiraceae bacterium]
MNGNSLMQYHIFISRHLDSLSPFHLLDKKRYCITGISLLKVTLMTINAIPACSWIFFYSRNGILSFWHNIQHHSLTIPSKIKFACLGPGTAQMLEKQIGHPPHFTGSGHPESSAKLFSQLLLPEDIVCFVTANNSKNSVEQLIPPWVKCNKVIAYHNEPNVEIKIAESDAYIFTSPMNAEAFYTIKKGFPPGRYIAIGETTATRLFELGAEEVVIAPFPSEKELIRVLCISEELIL